MMDNLCSQSFRNSALEMLSEQMVRGVRLLLLIWEKAAILFIAWMKYY